MSIKDQIKEYRVLQEEYNNHPFVEAQDNLHGLIEIVARRYITALKDYQDWSEKNDVTKNINSYYNKPGKLSIYFPSFYIEDDGTIISKGWFEFTAASYWHGDTARDIFKLSLRYLSNPDLIESLFARRKERQLVKWAAILKQRRVAADKKKLETYLSLKKEFEQ